MRIRSGTIYYLKSFVTLFFKTNWWIIPGLLLSKPQLLKIRGEKFQFFVENLMDVWTIKEVVIDDCYEIKNIPRQNVVFDIGTGVGDFSVTLSKRSKKILTYDPDETRAKLSLKNIKHNGCRNVFFRKKFVTSLDAIFQEYHAQTCDLLKIDCEGAEYEIFANTTDAYLSRVSKIVGEMHFFNELMKQNYQKLIKRLKKKGFEIKEVANPVHDSIIFFFANKI